MTTHPSEEQLNDPEGHELVNAIHGRQAQRRELGMLILGRTTTSAVEAVLAAGYRKPQQVTTVAELAALPHRTVILDRNGTAWQRFEREWVSWLNPGESSVWMQRSLPVTVLHVEAGQ